MNIVLEMQLIYYRNRKVINYINKIVEIENDLQFCVNIGFG